MFNNKIKFISTKEVLEDKETNPIPIKLNIPKWFKELDSKTDTVKNCMPFLDSLTTGYALKLPADLNINHNFMENNKQGSSMTCPFESNPGWVNEKTLNLNSHQEADHPTWQLKGSPLINKNKNFSFLKIIYPYKINTPKGYSCLFLPPCNNTDDRFEILPGIVDTDNYDAEINFPFTINGDKYPKLDTVFEKGTVFAQVIPFKRESWKMELVEQKKMRNDVFLYKWLTKIRHRYKNLIWNKKKFY
jgi:hypothetical protein